jgi:FemAB-related protein (PEP-CTERM system-associated)
MPDLQVRILDGHESAAWPEPLSITGGFVSLDRWSCFLRKIYGFEIFRIEAALQGEPAGFIVLCHVKHPLFGKYLTTAPFASYGGFAFNSEEARNALLEETRHLVRKLGAEYAVVRFADGSMSPPAGWIQQPIYSTYLLDLTEDPDVLLARFGSDHRNHVRKSLRKGFAIRFGQLDLVDETYEGLARSMHELGSPYHSKAYLHAMAESMGDNLEFAVVHDSNGRLAGAGAFILHRGIATNLHANILRRFRQDYAGEFLYWSVISRYSLMKYRVFDMGRSLIGSGNESFKMKWKPRRMVLAYWHAIRPAGHLPGLNQKNPKFRFAIWTWKRLPAFAVRLLGPGLIRGLA